LIRAHLGIHIYEFLFSGIDTSFLNKDKTTAENPSGGLAICYFARVSKPGL
jgi:hypothetical protein